MKQAFNAAVNASSFGDALGAVGKRIYERDGRCFRTKEDCSRAKAALLAVATAYPELEQVFYKGAARWLQQRDSDLAAAIMLLAIRRGILPLCLHDSFRAQLRHAGSLNEIMRQKWIEQVGTEPVLSLK